MTGEPDELATGAAVQRLEARAARSVSVGLLVTAAGGEVVWLNDALARMVGAGAADDLPGLPRDFAAMLRTAASELDGERGAGDSRLVSWQGPSGTTRWLQVRRTPLCEDSGPADPGCSAGHGQLVYEVTDVTDERQAQERARRRERRLSRVETLAQVGTWEWDIAAGEVLWSDHLLALFGVQPGEDMTFEKYQSLVHPDDAALINSTLEEALRTGDPFTYTNRMFLVDGVTERIFQCHGEIVTDAAGAPVEVLGTAHDITEHKRLQQELARLADRDPLTGLANRRGLTAALQQRLDAPAERTGALLLLDVDNFKHINDRRGHLTGDQVMCGLARLLTDHAGTDAIVARLGGDEFAVVLPDGDSADALTSADQLCAAVAGAHVSTDGEALRVTISIGVTPLALHTDITGLLAAADRALYEAKDAGRNQARLVAPAQLAATR